MEKLMTPFLLCFALTLAVPTWADDNKDSGSKEDPRFEPQGSITLAQLIKDLIEAGVLTDGTFQLGYNATVMDDADEVGHSVDMSLETRLVGIEGEYDGGYYSDHPGWLVLPFETTVRVSASEEGSSVDLRSLRAGIFRVLFDPAGINIQALSYAFKAGLVSTHQFEVASLTINEALDLTEDGNWALVIKFTGDIGFNWIGSVNEPTISAAIEEAPNQTAMPNRAGFGGSLGGSIGIRIHDKVLVEFLGGLDRAVGFGWKRQYTDDGNSIEYVDERSLVVIDNYLGGSVRYKVTPWLHLKGSVRQDWFTLEYTNENSPDASAAPRMTTGTLSAEVRW